MEPLYSDGDSARHYGLADRKDEAGIETHPYRSEFRRDYSRLVHSPAFRRLQGKTQLFSGFEGDFFRTRLTHSIEVAQVAKSIASKLNHEHEYFREHNIDYDLIEFSALAHDIGHPPFGHTGESELHRVALDKGGFEGNAQTLRVLSTLEKKIYDDTVAKPDEVFCSENGDLRRGIDPTFRSIASILKYDNEINLTGTSGAIKKGYYKEYKGLVGDTWKNISRDTDMSDSTSRKSIECSIMDLADDIAYSTFDLEDTLKSGIINLVDIVMPSLDIIEKIKKSIFDKHGFELSPIEVLDILRKSIQTEGLSDELKAHDIESRTLYPEGGTAYYLSQAGLTYQSLKGIGSRTYLRGQLTSGMIGRLLAKVDIDFNERQPWLSQIKLDHEHLLQVEVLKTFTYLSVIDSPPMKVVERRHKDIISRIYGKLTEKDGFNLLPHDFKALYLQCRDTEQEDESLSSRLIIDFISGMTDGYAIDFHNRLVSGDYKKFLSVT